MNKKIKALNSLVMLSRNLGNPVLDYVILGDGNSSAKIDDKTFWVKASGAQMNDIEASQFTELRTEGVLKMLEHESLPDDEIARHLRNAKVDPNQSHPSIESLFHALVITLCEAEYVGHTHPTPWVGILSSRLAREATSNRIFTEQINICGPAALFIAYTDPGIQLARQLKLQVMQYSDKYGLPPKEILLQNHGLIAIGKTPREVENITAMSVRAAKALQIAYTLGGPKFLSQEDVARILNRADEVYRRKQANI